MSSLVPISKMISGMLMLVLYPYTCGNAQMNVLKVRKALREVLHELGELRAFRPTVSRIGAAGVNRIQVAQVR